jgi:hypothetical protein
MWMKYQWLMAAVAKKAWRANGVWRSSWLKNIGGPEISSAIHRRSTMKKVKMSIDWAKK